ncbi:MAG: gamma-glutamylcyclotransferase [Microthrixaceae bacterium]|nr:gamma-glutamylcyclotransferase [Microthrixaceae bacterium]
MSPLRFAAYGTLRPGFPNARLWDTVPGVSSEPCVIPGVRLQVDSVPFARVDLGSEAVGDLITVPGEAASRVLERLDWLEGHPFLYVRVPWPCVTASGTVVCWLYLDATLEEYGRPVPGGDYANVRKTRTAIGGPQPEREGGAYAHNHQ